MRFAPRSKLMLQFLLTFSIFFSSINAQVMKVKNETQNKNYVILAECAAYVTNRYISPKTNTLVIQEQCTDCTEDKRDFNSQVLQQYLQQLHDENLSLQLFSKNTNEQLQKYYVFIVDNSFTFNQLGFNIPHTIYDRELYFIIIITDTDQTSERRQSVMQMIFTRCARMKVTSVVIMQAEKEKNEIIDIYSYSMSGFYCGQYYIIDKINSYRNKTLEHDFLFPSPQSDFHGCIINVTAHVLYPFVKFHGDHNDPTHLKDITRLNGMEGLLLRVLANSLNFRIKLKFPKEDRRTDIYTEAKSTEYLSMLDAGLAEIAIGGFNDSNAFRLKYSASMSYHQSSYIFVIRSGIHFGPIKRLAQPFDYTVWMIIGLTFLFVSIILKFVRDKVDKRVQNFIMGTNNDHPINNMFTILLGNPINRLPRRNFARFLVMCWLLTSILLRSAYQGKLFDSLRQPHRVDTPKKISELSDKNYKLLSPTFVRYYPRNQTILTTDSDNRYRIIDREKLSSYITISTLDTLGYYNWIHWNTSHLTYVKEPLRMFQLVMYYRKHSALQLIFNEKLQQIMSAGMVSYLANQNPKPGDQYQIKYQTSPCISNYNLMGLYRLYAIFSGLAVCVFLLEVVSYKFMLFRRVFA